MRATLAAFLTLGIAVAAFAVLVFAVFAAAVSAGFTQSFDDGLLRWIAARRTPFLDIVMLEATTLGNAAVMTLVVIVSMLFLWLTKHRWSVALLGIAGLGGPLINTLLKHAFGRPRPDVVEALSTVFSPSFPSGHAMNSLIVYGSVAYIVGRLEPTRTLRRATWLLAALLVLAIGVSRIYLGVHYPSDVLAGFVAGAGWLAFLVGGIAALQRFRPSE